MAGFRARNDDNNFFDFGNQFVGSELFLGAYGAQAATQVPASAILTPGPHALIDTVPGDTSTTATLTVGATSTISAIDTIADEDFYKITLVAGHVYEIGMFGYTPSGPGDPVGPNGSPLLDSFIELYDSAGNLITSADGGSDTTLNTANSGFDALLTFTATTSGTYYVNARAFDNVPADGDNGDMTGDYGLYAKDVTDAPGYIPYYSANSPLYAIDWGTQVNKVHQTYRNPDGNEGTHVTGNPQAPVDPGAPFGHPGKNVISIYFAQAGDVFVSNDPANPGLPPATITATGVQQFEHDAVMTALAQFSKVADVVYVEVNDRNAADFIYTSYQGTPGPGISLLGSMSPPDESDEGLAQFNSGDYRWNATDLQQGGFSFVTLIHELGHGHGLAHPHDNGGHSGIMHGVEPEGAGVADYTTGDFHLNQSVFTMMSYEDGWQDSPYGNAPTSGGYGYLGGLMAFDIAAIQDKYGVNEDWATGDNVYTIKDVNAPGTYYTSIWDAGGIDSIVYSGARNANIDLRAATLQYEWGGGGWVSYATGIFGGYTIANGVTIENAYGGSGNDVLIGNAVNNILDGGAGFDNMAGGAGNDLYYVDVSADVVSELAGEGNDRVFASASYALAADAEVETLSTTANDGASTIDLTGSNSANFIYGNDGINALYGGGGNDFLASRAGNDLLDGGTGNDIMAGETGNDVYYADSAADVVIELAGNGNDRVFASASFALTPDAEVETLTTAANDGASTIDLTGNGFANFIYGNDGINALSGGGGNDFLASRAGNDVLDGGAGNDTMAGETGNDVYYADSAGDLVVELAGNGNDRVFASASFALTPDAEVETLSTTDNTGTAAIDLTGSNTANFIYGNDGANTLRGAGGDDFLASRAGNDWLDGGTGTDNLHGGAGADTFAFTTALGVGNIDTILDFAAGTDKIALDDAVFTGLGLGGLSAGAFVVGTTAQDADDRIIYDQATGKLYFDADGNGAGAAVQFATLTDHPTIAASDFTVI